MPNVQIPVNTFPTLFFLNLFIFFKSGVPFSLPAALGVQQQQQQQPSSKRRQHFFYILSPSQLFNQLIYGCSIGSISPPVVSAAAANAATSPASHDILPYRYFGFRCPFQTLSTSPFKGFCTALHQREVLFYRIRHRHETAEDHPPLTQIVPQMDHY